MYAKKWQQLSLFPEDEVTKDYPILSDGEFELRPFSDFEPTIVELVAEDIDPQSYKWETQELRKAYQYDITYKVKGDNRGVFFLQGVTIVGYRILDDAGWHKLEGRRV